MDVVDITDNTLIRSKKSELKRGKTYVYDTMNLLYSMWCISAISDVVSSANMNYCTKSVIIWRVFFLFLTQLFMIFFTGFCLPWQMV